MTDPHPDDDAPGLAPLAPEASGGGLVPAGEVEAARAFASKARSTNTKRAYRADWSDFGAWCSDRGLGPLPSTPEAVSLYIAWLATPRDGSPGLKPSTLSRRLAAISQAHKMAGFESPALRSREPLHSVWAGIVRTRGVARDKVAPALTPDVVAMVEALPTVDLLDGSRQLTTASKRDRALLLVGFAGALRRSEIAALEVRDLAFGADGLRLRLRKSKTDQEGAGVVLGLHFGDRPLSCPVRAVQDWVRWNAITEGPIFRSVDRHGNVSKRALDSGSVARIVKRAAARAGLDPAAYSGHSLRAGFATQAARAGAHERAIMKHTRHKSEKVLREYIRDGQLFDENPTDSLGL